MHTNIPRDRDDLSAVERRLSGWRPDAEGLDPDAMLFAAGVAAGRSRGLLWPALCGSLAALALGLGAWGLHERSGREALAGLLHKDSPEVRVSPQVAILDAPQSVHTPSPGDYFRMRRQLERAPDRWLDLVAAGPQPHGPPPEPDIFRAGERERLLAP